MTCRLPQVPRADVPLREAAVQDRHPPPGHRLHRPAAGHPPVRHGRAGLRAGHAETQRRNGSG